MKNILSKIEFHYSYLIICIGFILTGYFSHLILFTSLILFHELGHVISMLYYGFKIDKIIIYPFGGLIKVSDYIDKDINSELIVSISGLVSQCLFYYIVCNFIDNRDYVILSVYHYSMFFLNIIPIYPLDGFKIVNLILNKFFSFNKSNYISLILSVIMFILIVRIGFYNYSLYMIIILLGYNIIYFYRNISYLFNRFLLERYLYGNRYNSIKIIDNVDNLYRNKLNYIKYNKKLIKEDKILEKMFDYK